MKAAFIGSILINLCLIYLFLIESHNQEEWMRSYFKSSAHCRELGDKLEKVCEKYNINKWDL